MLVRPMRNAELDEVVAIWHESREATHASMGIRGSHELTPQDSSRIFREVIEPRCTIWVAHGAAGLLGFLAIRGSYVDRMYVRPAAQRTGVGTALLRKARELSPTGLALHTHQKNERARRFYEKHGFRAVAFGTSPPPENEPDVEYRWRPETR